MVFALSILLLAAASPMPSSTPPSHVSKVNRAAITYVLREQYGPHTHLDSIVVVDSNALVWGSTKGAQFHDGMTLATSGWRVTCATGQVLPSAAHLTKVCGFHSSVATRLVEEQNANLAALHGDFQTAVIAEVHAHNASHTTSAFEQTQERARLQLLQQLKVQMQLGQITRQQAIQRWNQFQISF